MNERRYEISILVGPCSQTEAERIMRAAHEVAVKAGGAPGTALNFWDEEDGSGGSPGGPVEGVEVI